MKRTGMVVLACCVLVGLCVCASAFAVAEERAATAEDIRADIEELQERQEELEELAVQEDEFAQILAGSHESLEMYEEWLQDIKEREEPEGPAAKQYVRVEREHAEECCAIERRICGLKGVESLPEAKKLLDDLEVREMEYGMVIEPKHAMAAQIEELATAAEEVDCAKCEGVLKELERAHAAYVGLGGRQFELWKSRRQLERNMEELNDQFWGTLAEAEEDAEEK